MTDHSIIILFSNCIPVRGARRSIICDLFYQKYVFIPDTLFDILDSHQRRTMGHIKEFYDHSYDEMIEHYFLTLLKLGLAFECSADELDNYPATGLEWSRPNAITNAIIDIDPLSLYDIGWVARELDSVGCKALQIRIYQVVGIEFIREVLQFFERTGLRHIELLIRHNEDITEEDLIGLCHQYVRINAIAIHGSPENRIREDNRAGVVITTVKKDISSAAHCGVVNPALFNVSMENFTESLKFNSCLNRKIGVDVLGRIKNCPSMERSYGQVPMNSFLDVVEGRPFKEMWEVTKDQVSVCRDCEFRYICTDCRVYAREGDQVSLYGKPLKCGYDPYRAKWDLEMSEGMMTWPAVGSR
jgi:SPASM domain peptide maturase of grasp-with-spasm system